MFIQFRLHNSFQFVKLTWAKDTFTYIFGVIIHFSHGVVLVRLILTLCFTWVSMNLASNVLKSLINVITFAIGCESSCSSTCITARVQILSYTLRFFLLWYFSKITPNIGFASEIIKGLVDSVVGLPFFWLLG